MMVSKTCHLRSKVMKIHHSNQPHAHVPPPPKYIYKYILGGGRAPAQAGDAHTREHYSKIFSIQICGIAA